MSLARLARWALFALTFGALAFLVAGRTDLPRVWIWLGAVWAMMLIGLFWVPAETTSLRLKRGHRTADPMALALIRLFAVGSYALALLDVGRLHLGDSVPALLSALGLVVQTVAFAFILWAISVNRFFMPQVRIQSERGHHLIDTGPYGFVRHPGYAGMVFLLPATGLAIGSWLGCAAGLLASAAFVYRARGEDRFLRGNLEGYAAYAERVRYRIVPAVW